MSLVKIKVKKENLMKSLVLGLVVLLGIHAQAEVKPRGAIVPAFCSINTPEQDLSPGYMPTSIIEVCFAYKSQMKGQFLVVNYKTFDKQVREVLEIVYSANINNGYQGDQQLLAIEVKAEDGKIFRLEGTSGKWGVGTLRGEIRGMKVYAKEFMPMVTTKSL